MDKKLLDALNNLSVALGDIAQALADKSETSSATAKALQGGDFISEIKEINIGVKALQKDTKEILANQQTIMKMGSSKAKDSKTSEVENIGKDKKSQSAFKEGLGVILLIAVAVLALGVAFNIVGKVNFLSVIALALALPLLAIGFSKVLTTLKTVGFNAKEDGKNFLIAIGVIALSITMASWILGMIIPISFTKAMTATFIALTFALLAPSMQKFMMAFKGMSWMEILKSSVAMVIILPAMALGIAFASWAFQLIKPIGLMQFLTAVGISIAFVIISYGLRKMLKAFKGMDMATMAKTVLFLPLVLPAVALGIALSSYALQLVKPVGFVQMLTAIGISIAFTVIAYGLNKMLTAFKGVSKGQAIEAAIMLPILFVAISYAIAYSSVAFSKIVPIKFSQFLTAIGIAAVFVVISFGLKLMTNAISQLKWKDVLLIPALFTVMSLAITVSSFILSKATSIPFAKLMTILGFSIVASAAVVVMGGAIWVLNKMGVSIPTAIKGGIVIVILAAVIMASSLILNFGKYKNYPNWRWALGVALSLGAFGLGAVLLGTQALNPFFYAGLGIILVVAATIVATSYILAAGSYKKYPTVSWAMGVGLAMGAFGLGAVLLGTQVFNPFFYAGLGMILVVAATIVATSLIFAAGKFNTKNFPSMTWVLAASAIILGMGLIAAGLAIISPLIIIGSIAILAVAGTIFAVDKVFNFGKFKKYPSTGWLKGAMSVIEKVGDIAVNLSVKLPLVILGAISIAAVAASILAVDKIFQKGKFIKYPPAAWVRGTTLALTKWTKLMDSISFGSVAGGGIADFFGGGLGDVAESIVSVAKILSKAGNAWKSYPTGAWVDGVSSALTKFSKLSEKLDFGSDKAVIKAANGLTKIATAYDKLAKSVKSFTAAINTLDVKKIESFKSITGVLTNSSLSPGKKGADKGLFDSLLKVKNDLSKPVSVKSKSGAVSQSAAKDIPQAKDGKGQTQLQKLDIVIDLMKQMVGATKSIDAHLQNPKAKKNEDIGSQSD
jgi:hypothetical protein